MVLVALPQPPGFKYVNLKSVSDILGQNRTSTDHGQGSEFISSVKSHKREKTNPEVTLL